MKVIKMYKEFKDFVTYLSCRKKYFFITFNKLISLQSL